MRESQAGEAHPGPFDPHQKLLGTPEDAENMSSALGQQSAYCSLSNSRAVTAAKKPNSSCSVWKGQKLYLSVPATC